MRETADWLMPVALAIVRVLQCVAWRRLQRHRDYALDVRVADLSRRPRPRFIDQPVEALPHEARAPLANGGLRHALMPRDRGVRIPGRRT
jgi:hypothetical protein